MEITADRAIAITGATNWATVAAEYPAEVAAIGDGLLAGDPLADAVIEELFAHPRLTWQQVIDALDRPDELTGLPPALRQFLQTASRRPDWFDPALADAGAQAWWRFGTLQSSALYQSLIYGYQARGFTRPLIETGRLTEGTWDRVQSTARWVALATAPGMMAPGAAGWTETMRIRLVHAMVRHHLYAEGWNDDELGVPINQTYGQLTITAGFLVLPMRVAKDFGIRYSGAELAAITHLWRWIGWVMGVDEKLLPRSFADARRTFEISRRFQMRPDDDSKTLVRALLDDGFRVDLGLPGPLGPAVDWAARPLLRTLFSSVSTRWVEPETARGMGLRATPLHHVVDLARPVVWMRELTRATGLLGSERRVARRELRLVTGRLGMDLSDPVPAVRRSAAGTEPQETVA